jgi:hypothetical protein
MDIMDATTARPARRRAILASVVVAAAAALSACSSSTASSETDAAAVPFPQAEQGAPALDANDAVKSSTADRAVIVTGATYMTVDDPIATASQATHIVEAAGGRIDAHTETAPDGGAGGSAHLTLRIPADHLDAVVQQLRALGKVDEFDTNSTDVTAQVRDLGARIDTLRGSTERIRGLLDSAKDIKDIITLENELDRRQSELESLEAQQRGLDDQVSMSSIDLSLTTKPIVAVDDSPKSFGGAIAAGWHALVGFLSGALIVFGVALPWLVLAAVIALPIVITSRSRQSRRASAVERPAAKRASATK